MDDLKAPAWYQRHQWWIRLGLEALAVIAALVGIVVALVH